MIKVKKFHERGKEMLHVKKSGDLVRKLVHVRKDAQKDLTQSSCGTDLLGDIFPMHLSGAAGREPTVPLPRVVLDDPGRYSLVVRPLPSTSFKGVYSTQIPYMCCR